jgi:hypothetical protein
MDLLTKASVAIDGSKFKAVNNRDRNFTRAKVERRRAQLEESVACYLSQLDTIDLQGQSETLALKAEHLKEKLAKLESEMRRLAAMEKLMLASPTRFRRLGASPIRTGTPRVHVSTNHQPHTATQWPVTIRSHACSNAKSFRSRAQVARVGELRLKSATPSFCSFKTTHAARAMPSQIAPYRQPSGERLSARHER